MVLVLALLALLVPVAAYADDGPCPDDPVDSENCTSQAPPYYVVSNGSSERLGTEYGTGCQPWILEHPDCRECFGDSEECFTAEVDVEQIICGFEMPEAGAKEGDVLHELCCNCPAGDSNGSWTYRERVLQKNPTTGAWECPNPGAWQMAQPPDTGIDLPAYVVVGGLATIGAMLLFTGVVVRRLHLRLL
jgi:hypothetical protein